MNAKVSKLINEQINKEFYSAYPVSYTHLGAILGGQVHRRHPIDQFIVTLAVLL